jgi:hypothetical protein
MFKFSMVNAGEQDIYFILYHIKKLMFMLLINMSDALAVIRFMHYYLYTTMGEKQGTDPLIIHCSFTFL